MPSRRTTSNRRTTKANGSQPSQPIAVPVETPSAEIPSAEIPSAEGVSAETPQSITDPAILVVRIPGEQPGQYNIHITEVNGMDPFAVPATLKLAAKVKNLQLGLKEED